MNLCKHCGERLRRSGRAWEHEKTRMMFCYESDSLDEMLDSTYAEPIPDGVLMVTDEVSQ